MIGCPPETQRSREIFRHLKVGVWDLPKVVSLKLGEWFAEEVVMATCKVSRHHHSLKLVQKVFWREHRSDQEEKLSVIKDTLNVAEKAFHDVIISTLFDWGPEFFEEVALCLWQGFELMTRELRCVRLVHQMVMMMMSGEGSALMMDLLRLNYHCTLSLLLPSWYIFDLRLLVCRQYHCWPSGSLLLLFLRSYGLPRLVNQSWILCRMSSLLLGRWDENLELCWKLSIRSEDLLDLWVHLIHGDGTRLMKLQGLNEALVHIQWCLVLCKD